jgi:hypothetical protein
VSCTLSFLSFGPADPGDQSNEYWEWVAPSTVATTFGKIGRGLCPGCGAAHRCALRRARDTATALTKALGFPIVAAMSGLFAICGICPEIIS